jgi:Rrf2 family protein
MTLSKTTEYALQVLAFMAEDTKSLYSSDQIHKKLKIPKKYLQRLLTDLSKNGLIISERGKYGGFKIAKNPKKIFLADIIEAVEGFSKTTTCFFGFGKCALNEPCAMHAFWEKSQKELIKKLSSTPLSDIIKS